MFTLFSGLADRKVGARGWKKLLFSCDRLQRKYRYQHGRGSSVLAGMARSFDGLCERRGKACCWDLLTSLVKMMVCWTDRIFCRHAGIFWRLRTSSPFDWGRSCLVPYASWWYRSCFLQPVFEFWFRRCRPVFNDGLSQGSAEKSLPCWSKPQL